MPHSLASLYSVVAKKYIRAWAISRNKSDEQLREMGYDIFILNVPQDEQRMLLEINRAGWQLFQGLPLEQRLTRTIFYSFHFMIGKRKVLVDHRLTPVKLDGEGRCRIALCVFSPSSFYHQIGGKFG